MRLLLLATVLVSAAAVAQTPPKEEFDYTYEELIGPQKLPALFDPAAHGMEAIEEPHQLFSLLTKKGRCPPKKTAKPGVPCAFISYAPPNTRADAYLDSLRPVFSVESENRIWTYLRGELSLVRVSDLWSADDLADPGASATTYKPTAIVGFDENQNNCSLSKGQSCVSANHFLIFIERGLLSPGCVDEIWSRRGGATGSGVQSRCRFNVPGR